MQSSRMMVYYRHFVTYSVRAQRFEEPA
jgi:hypothetical protein